MLQNPTINMTEEEAHQLIQVNYSLGKYGKFYCENCNQYIESYFTAINFGLCRECFEEFDQ